MTNYEITLPDGTTYPEWFSHHPMVSPRHTFRPMSDVEGPTV